MADIITKALKRVLHRKHSNCILMMYDRLGTSRHTECTTTEQYILIGYSKVTCDCCSDMNTLVFIQGSATGSPRPKIRLQYQLCGTCTTGGGC